MFIYLGYLGVLDFLHQWCGNRVIRLNLLLWQVHHTYFFKLLQSACFNEYQEILDLSLAPNKEILVTCWHIPKACLINSFSIGIIDIIRRDSGWRAFVWTEQGSLNIAIKKSFFWNKSGIPATRTERQCIMTAW